MDVDGPKRAPVLTMKQLQRWQKGLLEVFHCLLLVIGTLSGQTALLASGMEETRHRLSLCCPYERRGQNICIHDREFVE